MDEIKKVSLIRVVRNVIFAIFSVTWLIPLSIAVEIMLKYLSWVNKCLLINQQFKDAYPFWTSVSPSSMLGSAINSSLLFLGLVVFVWALLLANKIWPVRRVVKPNT